MLQLVFTSAKKSVIARQCLVRLRRTLRLTTGTHACKVAKKQKKLKNQLAMQTDRDEAREKKKGVDARKRGGRELHNKHLVLFVFMLVP